VNAPRALTLLDIIRIVLPDGTQGTGDWDTVCDWPPDLFGVVASITERSGLYSEHIFTNYWSRGFVPTDEWIEDIRRVAGKWAERGSPPKRVRTLWQDLVSKHGNARIDSTGEWKKVVFELLVIADETCAGVGFLPDYSIKEISVFQYAVYKEFVAWSKRNSADPDLIGAVVLPYLPISLCIHVPTGVLCVQPKATTPAVGCTLRSLTHNLALLPSAANVKMWWYPADESREHNDPFNILVVPFPFSIPGRSFSPVDGCFPGDAGDRVFTLDPDKWMNRNPAGWPNKVSAKDFANFLCGLIDAANPELEPIHAIVLPETAIRIELANEVANILAAKTGLDMLLTGVASRRNGTGANLAGIYRFLNKRVVQRTFQSKHHRWGLDGDQIRRYHLGHVLDPDSKWWEQIEVSKRACYITSFRSYATLSVLVCEDLARYDPVLTVMNAMGPNLVVALLMDGPQFEYRWPGRYATALAEDPGSAVLTVTSLGMVSRSRNPGDAENREIALWKQPNGRAQVLKLPSGCHGLLLTLTNRLVEQFTLDGRGDRKATMQFTLGAAHGITHPNPPAWIGRVP
jgi:hypothetical protein